MEENQLGEKTKALFAAGCFWGVESFFQKLEGVTDTTVGYCNGKTDNPTYQQVCSGNTGHAEAIQIEFNPNSISYLDLVNHFWKMHNPTTLNRQGPDVGSQYRSAIFYFDKEQKIMAESSKKELDQSETFNSPIVTEVVAAEEFYPAEDYHQDYHKKNGGGCSI